MIEVSHLTKQYGNHLAVDDVSFTVADGQICGLLGPNGAGKSTIMNILTGYLSATSGQVTVAGHPLPEEADAAKACVGYLPEQPPLYSEMTVQEYLDFAAELKGIKKKADRKEQVRKAARRTGLEEVLPRLIRSLSKGYRQRVGIAQALLGAPQLIIPVSYTHLDVYKRQLHISPAYLSAQLKKYQKMNFLDCLTELRINAAKELLTDPFRSAAEVASMVGYEDSSYFARTFKKRTGMTPTQYRREAAKACLLYTSRCV